MNTRFAIIGLTAAATMAAHGQERPGAAWITPAVRAPRLHHCTFDSAAANTGVSYHIYTPEAYEREAARRFPVLYWLHGRGGGAAGLPRLVDHFDSAIHAGRMPPMLIVFPNGLAHSMWCDSKDGRVPMETVVIRELIPHIDASFRTLASRDGRRIEGFSMGGYGAARLAFKYPDLFAAVSILGAGPLQPDFRQPPPGGGVPGRDMIYQETYGADADYFSAQSPWSLAGANAARLSGSLRIRMAVGDRDAMLVHNRDFHGHLKRLGIPHEFTVAPGVGHGALAVFAALGEANWSFYTAGQVPEAGTASSVGAREGRRVFFAFSKARVRDPVPMQQRGWDAVQAIRERIEPLEFSVHLLRERVRSADEYRNDPLPFQVTRERILGELESLRHGLGSNDTIVIYSHSHGLKDRDGHPGGLLLDDRAAGRGRPPVLAWSEYADHLLRLPAKTVVVLAMACHSGGLVEFLERDDRALRSWRAREEQGRNFLVLTSQNADSLSNPRRIDGVVINPFTYALIKAFDGGADGYRRGRGDNQPDGRLTLGELADFVMDEARKHTRPEDGRNDPDPQLAGSYSADAVLAVSRRCVPPPFAVDSGALCLPGGWPGIEHGTEHGTKGTR